MNQPTPTTDAPDGENAQAADPREVAAPQPARETPPPSPTVPTQRPARSGAPVTAADAAHTSSHTSSHASSPAGGSARPAGAVLPRQRALPTEPGTPSGVETPVRTIPTQRAQPSSGGAHALAGTPAGLVASPTTPAQDPPAGTPSSTQAALPPEVARRALRVADELRAPRTLRPAHRRALRAVAVVGIVALAATATGGWVAQDRAHRQDVARAEARARVDAVTAAVEAQAPSGARVEVATWTGARSSEVAALTTAVEAAAAALAATTHAPADARTALQRAIDTARTTAADDAASLHALRTARAGLVGPQKTAQDGEKAWQKAEEERKAAEAAAAAERARQRVAAPPRSTTTRPRTGGSTPVQRGIPAGGLVCSGTGGSGAREASASTLGAAINSYRASLGLPKLSVARSGSLTSHALDMGTRGGIWHSGGDNIVGCVGTSTASYLVQAWAHSASHDKQMRRTDVSTMYVGAATQSGWLFGAVLFR